ncbi:BrnT family toxin [Segnochrobactrum spirostomi]|uniref:BrnT family toxin n=1 Tax=Segnochrobactrum spirostomi TaxID=2608987 RepID=A0A6A7Y034_9HYPH|nr:BrnT family toxin [Segnochrobactrum spirostomi]MQT12095.1 BrnT family toxin [Segnochrobactrum spirostomi]
MFDWTRISGFDWDEGNARKSTDKHGVSQAEAEQIFFNEPLLLAADVAHSNMERRIQALGRTDAGLMLQVTFTLREDATKIRVISARPMSRRERKEYGEAD